MSRDPRALLALGLLFACKQAPTAPPAGGGDGGVEVGADATVVPPPPDAGPPPEFETKRSGKARVRWKGDQRIANDLSQALELPKNELCKEVGRFDCLDVHAIPLGGVEPYLKGIFEPLPTTAVTTPLAIERLVMSACAERVTRDGGRPDGLIFKDIQLTAELALADPAQPELRAAFELLYRRMLQRPMSDAEWGHIRGLYDEILAAADPAPAPSWATLGCFAVGTSMEALFY